MPHLGTLSLLTEERLRFTKHNVSLYLVSSSGVAKPHRTICGLCHLLR